MDIGTILHIIFMLDMFHITLGGPASEMTYIVSGRGAALNFTHSLVHENAFCIYAIYLMFPAVHAEFY